MKKFLYIAPILINFKKLDGVAKKVINQYSIFKKYYDSTLISYGVNGIMIIKDKEVVEVPYGNNHRRTELYKTVVKIIQNEPRDSINIRYPRSEPKFINMLKTIKKISDAKIVIEIPTYPYRGEIRTNINTMILSPFDFVYRNKLKSYVDRIVTYSKDDEIFGIRTIKTVNGIVFDNISMNKPKTYEWNENKTIEILAVAMLLPCHGYDRLIKGIKNYYELGGKRKVVFNIVGDGKCLYDYKKIIEENNLEKSIKLLGFKGGKELEELYKKADIAVNSIAIHRIKLDTESTLKAKEYAAHGLPMISSYKIDTFNDYGNSKFVHMVSPDDSDIDVDGIIDFLDNIYLNNKKDDIADEIRESAKLICDMEITLKCVMEFFEGNNNNE